MTHHVGTNVMPVPATIYILIFMKIGHCMLYKVHLFFFLLTSNPSIYVYTYIQTAWQQKDLSGLSSIAGGPQKWEFVTFVSCNLKSIFPTSDSFLLLMSHISNLWVIVSLVYHIATYLEYNWIGKWTSRWRVGWVMSNVWLKYCTTPVGYGSEDVELSSKIFSIVRSYLW